MVESMEKVAKKVGEEAQGRENVLRSEYNYALHQLKDLQEETRIRPATSSRRPSTKPLTVEWYEGLSDQEPKPRLGLITNLPLEGPPAQYRNHNDSHDQPVRDSVVDQANFKWELYQRSRPEQALAAPTAVCAAERGATPAVQQPPLLSAQKS